MKNQLIHNFILRSAIAVSAITMASSTSLVYADAPMVKTQAPAFYRMMLGEVEITALLDENSPWPGMEEFFFPKTSKDELSLLRASTKLQLEPDFSTNTFLVNTGKKLVLVDTGGKGSNPKFNYGQIFTNLKAAGYRPEQIDDIFITHAHQDHIGGMSENGVRLFPNATVHIDALELAQLEKLAAQGNAGAKEGIAKFSPYIEAKKYHGFDGDTEFFPGFRAIASYGHTDGHSFYAIESKGKKMLFWGDFLVNDKIQFEIVEAIPPGERDAAKGTKLRQVTFSEAAKEAYLIGGAHFSFPGIGRVRDLGGKYIWVPVDYASIPLTQAEKS